MSRCADCRWWRDPRDIEELGARIGECVLTESASDMNGPPKKSLASAAYGPGHYAILETEATFGCVQWERRE